MRPRCKPQPPALDPSDYEYRVAHFALNETSYGQIARLAESSPLAAAARTPAFREAAAAARARRKRGR